MRNLIPSTELMNLRIQRRPTETGVSLSPEAGRAVATQEGRRTMKHFESAARLDQYRDDCSTAFNLARREILAAGVFLVSGLATLSIPPAMAARAAWSDESATRFMKISSLLIPHRLNEEVGKRIGVAMSALNPSLSEHVTELLAIAAKKNARIVEDFFPDV